VKSGDGRGISADPALSRKDSGAPTADISFVRGVNLGAATALNMIDMIGVGPFITIPIIVAVAGGPQAMLGWIAGAFLAVCDGLVWAELGAAMPRAGGSYRYLNEIYGPRGWGRLFSFLFIWQLTFSAPLSIASGALGLSGYATFLWPSLDHRYFVRDFLVRIPGLGPLEAHIVLATSTLVAVGVCLVAVLLLYRGISGIARLSKLLWFGVAGTIAWIIFAGLTHFNPARAFDFPPGAFELSRNFFTGMGAALLVATYDYWGYYNVCFLGEEIEDPARNIPRALLLSIAAVAVIYVVMNISILGVVPWREMLNSAKSDTHFYIVSVFIQRLYGTKAAYIATALIMWTAFASVFSLLLGYSRVPYAAAVDGNYFHVFSSLHPQKRFPHISLLTLGGVAALFCALRLQDVIAALVVIRILVQFILQAAGLLLLRARHPEYPRPFRMWFYPVPALLAIAGFIFVVISRKGFAREVRYAVVIVVIGVAVYLVRAALRREWPFAVAESS
jgi:basic amino acid/polyamine antiporter, APA family